MARTRKPRNIYRNPANRFQYVIPNIADAHVSTVVQTGTNTARWSLLGQCSSVGIGANLCVFDLGSVVETSDLWNGAHAGVSATIDSARSNSRVTIIDVTYQEDVTISPLTFGFITHASGTPADDTTFVNASLAEKEIGPVT